MDFHTLGVYYLTGSSSIQSGSRIVTIISSDRGRAVVLLVITEGEPPPPDLRELTPVFLAIHLIGGHIGLPLLVATFLFSKHAKRPSTIINFCIIWILYSIIYCLLAVVAGLAVVLQVWSTFVEPWKDARLAGIPRWVKLSAIILPPYLAFIAFSLAGGYYGLKHPEWVTVKNGLYCGLLHGEFEMLAVPIFCGVFVLLIIGFEVATIVRYFRGRRIIKQVFPLVDPKRPSLSPWCRAALFLVYATLTFSACVMDLKQDMNAFGYMVQAALPLAAFLIFGLQKDVVLTWLYWNRTSKWRPDDPAIRVSTESGHVVRTPSFMSGTTIDSTTPIATHPPSSTDSHAGGSIV
ncbi:hypothetical protein OH77DRAFT_427554 [Trametes cingulata]|nr:hypothetical protein OH77DRAFT_427554 [Trametes cingulata]